jgi:hypothetical protein
MSEAIEATTYGWFNGTGANGNASFGTEDGNLVVTFDDASVLEIEDIKGFFNGKKAAEEGAVVKFALSDSPEEDREALATVLFKNGVTVDGYDYVAAEDKAVAVDPDIINAKKNVSLVFGTKVMAEEDFTAAWDESDEKAGKVKMLMALARDISGKPVYDEAKAREIVEKDNYGILGVFFERKAESLAESRISKEYKDVVNDLWKEYDAKIASLTKEERFAAKDKFRSFIVKEYDVSKLNEYKSDFDAFYAEVQKTEVKNSAFDDKFVLPRLGLPTSKEERSADISDYSEEKDRIRVPSSEDFKNWGNEGTYYHFDTKNKWLEYRAAERGMTSPYTFIDIVDDRERKCGYAPFATDVGREEVLGKACDGLKVYFDGHPVASKNKSRDRNFLISKGGYNSDGIFLKREVKVFAQDFDFEMALSILGKEASENDVNHFNLKVRKDEHLLMYLKAIAALNGQRDESDQITFEIVNPEQRHLFDEHKDELDKIKAANRAIYAANKAKEQELLGERDGRSDEIDEEAAARAKLIKDTIDALKAHGLSVDDYKTLTDAKVGDDLMLLALADKDARTAALAAVADGKLGEYVADAAVADKLATYGDLLTNEESVRKAYNTAIEGLDAALAAAKDREAEAKAVEDAVAALKGISADDKELIADYRDLTEKGAAKGLMLHALLGGKDVRADMLAASDLKDYRSAHADDIAKADKLLQNLNVKIAYTDATALLDKAVEAAKARELLIAEAIDKLEKSDITVDEYISLSEVSTNSAMFLSLTDKTFRKELIDAVNNGDRGNYLKSKEDELVAAENLLDSEDRVFKAFSAKINSLEAAKAEKEAKAKRIAAEDKRFSDNLEANGLTVADMFKNLEKEIEKAKRIAAEDKRFSDNLEANGLTVADMFKNLEKEIEKAKRIAAEDKRFSDNLEANGLAVAGMFNNLEKEIKKAKRIAAADKRFSDNLEANGLAVAGMFENFENKMQAINEVLTALNSTDITVENYAKLKEIADGYSDINRDAFMLIGISDEEALNDILEQGWDNYKETRPGAYEFAEELLNETEIQNALDRKIVSLEDELAESLRPRTRQELDQIRREEIRRNRESGISTQTGIREVQPVVIQENRNLTVSFTHINNELVVIINPNTVTEDRKILPNVNFDTKADVLAYNELAERINAGGSQFSCRAKFASVEEEQKFISTLTDIVINEAKGKVVDDPTAERVAIRQQPAVSVQNDLKNVSNGLTKTLDLSDEDILNILNKQELNTLRADKDFNKAVLVVIVNTKDPEKGKRAKDLMLEKGIAGFRKADRGAYNKAIKRYEDKDVQQLIDEIIFRIDEKGDVERIGPAPSNEQDLFVERKKEVLTALNSTDITVEKYVKLKKIADEYSDINRDAFMLIGISDKEALNDILEQGWDNYKETRPGAYEFAEELLKETEVQNALNSKVASLEDELAESLKPSSRQEIDQMRREEMKKAKESENSTQVENSTQIDAKDVELVTLKENKNLRVRFTRDERADELVVIINPNTKTRDRRPQPGVRFNPEEGLIAYNNLAERINAGGSQFSCRAKFVSVEEEQTFISTLTDMVEKQAKGTVTGLPAENVERIGPAANTEKETVEQMAKVREESERNAESLDLVKEVEVAEKAAAAREETISKMAQVQQNANALKSVLDAKVAAAKKKADEKKAAKEARISKTNMVMEKNFEASAAAFSALFGETKFGTKEISSDDEVSVTSGLFGTRGRVVKTAIGWSEERINGKLSGVFGEICKDKNLFREGVFADEFSKIINGYTNAEGQHVDGYMDRFGKNLSAIMSTATKAVDHRVLVALNLHETGAWEDLIAQVSENTGIDTNQGDEITEQVRDAEKMFYNYLVNPKGVGPTEMKPVSLNYVTQSVNKTISGAAFKIVEQYPETQEYFEGWVSDTKKTGVASVRSYAGQNKKDDFEAFTKPAELMCYIATQEDEEAKKLREGIKKVLVAEKSSLSK